jgi:hypothetical protein
MMPTSYTGTAAKAGIQGQNVGTDVGTIAGALSAGVTGVVGESFSIGFAGNATVSKFLDGAGKTLDGGVRCDYYWSYA